MESRRTAERHCASENLTSSSHGSREWKHNLWMHKKSALYFSFHFILLPPLYSACSLWCISWTHTFCILVYWWLCLLQAQDMGTIVVVEVALLSAAWSHYILEQSRLFSVVPLYCIWLHYPKFNSQECELPYIMAFKTRVILQLFFFFRPKNPFTEI